MKMLCPYCKQEIDETNEICPFCTTNLVKSDYKKFLLPLGIGISTLWTVFNFLILIVLRHFLKFLTLRDKDGILVFSLVEFITFCIQPVIFAFIPYIMGIINKYKIKACIIGMITCVIFAIIFVSYFIYLEHLAGV